MPDSPVHILLVDDNEPARYVKARTLRQAGWVVTEAPDAETALELAQAQPFDLAILDVNLPDLSGHELCRRIKEAPGNLLVLQTSATFVDREDRIAGLDRGADAYMVEPASETEFLAQVRALLRIRAAELRLADAEALLAHALEVSEIAAWRWDLARNRCVWSRNMAKLLQVPAEVLKGGDGWLDFVLAEDRPALLAAFAVAAKEGVLETEFRVRRGDGAIRWLAARGRIEPRRRPRRETMIAVNIDITERKKAEEQIRLLMGEVNHRAKNLLGVAQGIARLSARGADPVSFAERFSNRITALARNQELLISNSWSGVGMPDLVQSQIAPFQESRPSRVILSGPDVRVSPASAQALGLALHELATNAVKYGALSNAEGRVEVTWRFVGEGPERLFCFKWREEGGPPVTPPQVFGFGRELIVSIVKQSLNAEVTLEFPPEGAVCEIAANADRVIERSSARIGMGALGPGPASP